MKITQERTLQEIEEEQQLVGRPTSFGQIDAENYAIVFVDGEQSFGFRDLDDNMSEEEQKAYLNRLFLEVKKYTMPPLKQYTKDVSLISIIKDHAGVIEVEPSEYKDSFSDIFKVSNMIGLNTKRGCGNIMFMNKNRYDILKENDSLDYYKSFQNMIRIIETDELADNEIIVGYVGRSGTTDAGLLIDDRGEFQDVYVVDQIEGSLSKVSEYYKLVIFKK